ncbi:MAG: cell division protein FtsA [Muribaculaceae bacterium]|nr:cell division protein FtsA [Muribaculaceae bacterium]
MEKEQYIAALEIGSSKIVGAVAIKNANGTVELVAMEEEKLVDCIRYGCIQNIEETNTRVNRIIRKLENQVSPRKIKSVFVGVEGRSLRSITGSTEMQLPNDTQITDQHIEQLKKEIRRDQFDGFEILDVLPKKYIVNKAEYKSVVGLLSSHISATFNLIVAKHQIKSNIKRVVEERLQLAVKEYFVTPISLGKHILSYDERQLGCMLVDFGAETTTIAIYKNDVLLYMLNIPLGSRNITRDIMSLNILEENADELKKTIGNALSVEIDNSGLKIEGINRDEVSNYIVARAGEVASNIVAQLDYAKLTTADIPGGIILVGGGSKLNGFAELLAQQTKLKVRKGMPPAEVNILNSKAQNLEYAQIVSIIVDGANAMGDEESCCIKPLVIHHEPAVQAEPKPEPKPATPKKDSVFKSLFTRIKTTAEDIFNENDDDDDDVEKK